MTLILNQRFNNHVREARNIYDNKVLMVALQGSQNYGLDYEGSDVDTKALLVPSFEDIVFNKKPISTTHVRYNDEHIDMKDVRLMVQTWRKQNINFIEVLFTDYMWVNPKYDKPVKTLIDNSELIARYNPYAAVKCMKGMALEKYHALEHPYPSKADVLAKFGYDPKQLSHIVRLRDFLNKYIGEESYSDCLIPADREWIIDIKKGKYNLNQARILAKETTDIITKIADIYCERIENEINPEADEILNNFTYDVMKIAMKEELK